MSVGVFMGAFRFSSVRLRACRLLQSPSSLRLDLQCTTTKPRPASSRQRRRLRLPTVTAQTTGTLSPREPTTATIARAFVGSLQQQEQPLLPRCRRHGYATRHHCRVIPLSVTYTATRAASVAVVAAAVEVEVMAVVVVVVAKSA
jgi:hypothetical protein